MNVDFGYKHLTGLAWLFALITIVLVVVLVVKKKGNFGTSFDRKVIRYTCYFMWAWEIIKTFRIVNHADFGAVGAYPVWMAPFHICSMGLYAYLIISSKRQGKLVEWVNPFAYAMLMVATSIILTIPASSGILGPKKDWSFCFDNILPYQSWLYHGSLLFGSLYMVLSGFYSPKWKDIYKAAGVLLVLAAFAQTLNFAFEGSGADFMMLRYGNGNPLAFLLTESPVLYYVLLAVVAVAGIALVIGVTIGIKTLTCRVYRQRRSCARLQSLR